MPVTYFKTCTRYNIPGHAHYLTFSCFHGQPFLSKPRSCQWLVDAIARAKKLHEFHLWAWVIMPEHVHLLVWPRRKLYSISAILQSIKKPVTNKALHFVDTFTPAFAARMVDRQPNGDLSRRFWQRGGGHDRNIYSAEEVWEKIDYIHKNPFRRGLVARAQDWQWSSAQEYTGDRPAPLLALDRESLPIRRT